MKKKFLLFCMKISVLLVLIGCKGNEVQQGVTTGCQNLYVDDTKNEEEIGRNNQRTEDSYLLFIEDDFYEKVADNPIDKNYIIDGEAATLEIWQAALEKCEAWNQQMDFTAEQLEGLLNKDDYDNVQKAVNVWNEYYQEEVGLNRELYGANGMILGSMYTVTSADVLMEKSKLVSVTLLSLEYELSQDISFTEEISTLNEETLTSNYVKWYDFSEKSFCVECSGEFEETLSSYGMGEKNSVELEALIHETAFKIEEKFGHDFTAHADKYVSFLNELNEIEKKISEDTLRCQEIKENRLRLYATELLNIAYMLEV